MRPLKYRAWYPKYERLTQVLTINIRDRRVVVDLDMWSFDECELMQFTGLKDKNGKEVYEGDLVHVEGFGTGAVGFRKGTFILTCNNDRIALEDTTQIFVEIIGNIYENPELIPEGKI